jgi:hypothetical protein
MVVFGFTSATDARRAEADFDPLSALIEVNQACDMRKVPMAN